LLQRYNLCGAWPVDAFSLERDRPEFVVDAGLLA
jgi:hypothetical protein